MTGQHRPDFTKPAVAAWLGAGALTLGIAAAMTTGTAVANAETDDSGGSSTSAHDGSGAPEAGPARVNSGPSTTAPKKKPRPQPASTSLSDDGTKASSTAASQTTVRATTQKRTPKTQDAQTTKLDEHTDSLSAAHTATAAPKPSAKAPKTNVATTTNPIAAFFTKIQRTYFNRTPTATLSGPTLTTGGTYEGDFTGHDADDDPLTYSVAGGYGGEVSIDSTGHYTFAPGPALAATGGTTTFIVKATETNADTHIHGIYELIVRYFRTLGGAESEWALVTDLSSYSELVEVTVAKPQPTSA